jgi:aldehyde:ferredoxin oxidoreductase
MMGDQMVADLVGHVLDMKIDERDVQRIGERIWNLERLYNNRAGLTRKDDSLPPRMLEEPLTEGAARGHVVPLEEMLDDYYQYRGWDHEGRPTPQKLAELGLA